MNTERRTPETDSNEMPSEQLSAWVVPSYIARKLERERDEALEREAKWKAECKRQWMHLSQARHNAIAIQNIRWGFDGDCGATRLANLIEEDCDRGMMVSAGKDFDALRSEVEE